jgi:Cell wall binding domain 2 (CWB2)
VLALFRRARSVAVLGAAALALGVAPVAAETPDPSPWPARTGVDPGIEATAHSIRIAGPDRVQTALSAALLLRGNGTYPFGTADRTSGAAATLADAEQWWGLGTCPFAVIITAGDTAADSLAAASLSDPTDGSTEPRLTRSASSNPSFDPVGATALVDTDSAPIVVTASARQGATQLSPAAREAVADLADGGCGTVNAAIVVGGSSAVPTGVDQQLLGFVDQVFRVAGNDRFGTAAAIALALGTGESPNGVPCADPVVTDGSARMGFHGNAAVELRSSSTECEVLGRTVVLTDGTTGADALAAGWWTSTWQVPVLLVDGNGNLPAATLETMNALVIDNVVVLGGSARVPAQTVFRVEQLTGAAAVRVAGTDRYETSVEMAAAFGGWFPTTDGTDHDASMVCLAASSGTGTGSAGWPDALGAGPWCAAAGGLASATPAPQRALPPVSGAYPRATRAATPSHDAVPVLLTPAGSAVLPDPVAELLAAAYDPADIWCSSVQASDACLDPGFVVAFGGTAVLPYSALRQATRAVSGETYVVVDDRSPTTAGGFWTALDLRPVYADGGAADDVTTGRVCLDRATLGGVRWLGAYAGTGMMRFLAEHDLFTRGRYVADADGRARSPGDNAPSCLRVPGPLDEPVEAVATSLSGHVAGLGFFDPDEALRFALSDPIVQVRADVAEGTDTSIDGDDGSTSRVVFADDGLEGIVAHSRSEPATVTAASIDLVLWRGGSPDAPDSFTATVTLTTSLGTVIAEVSGEAVFDGQRWALRGRTTFTDGTWNATQGAGGFAADLVVNQTDSTDDEMIWRFDGLLVRP